MENLLRELKEDYYRKKNLQERLKEYSGTFAKRLSDTILDYQSVIMEAVFPTQKVSFYNT